MKLALSNLALSANVPDDHWAKLSKAGLSGIEVAPTRIGDWATLSSDCLSEFRTRLSDHELAIPSLQAILFGVPDIALLGGPVQFQSLCDHMHRVGATASTLQAGVAVFGAPRQRSKGDLLDDEAFKLGVDRFCRLAEICAQYDLVIGLEPVPAAYGGDFLPTWQEVSRMVEEVSNPHLRVHLDTACVLLGGGDIAEAIAATSSSLAHFHIAEPKLTNFSSPVSDHNGAVKALDSAHYNKWLSIEMMENPEQPFDYALAAVTFAMEIYKSSGDETAHVS